jgi:hypothetical protein
MNNTSTRDTLIFWLIMLVCVAIILRTAGAI